MTLQFTGDQEGIFKCLFCCSKVIIIEDFLLTDLWVSEVWNYSVLFHCGTTRWKGEQVLEENTAKQQQQKVN